MIGVLKVRESFSLQEWSALESNCRKLLEEFPETKCEFFDTLSQTDPERFFIIRIATKEKEKFVSAVEVFGKNLDFELLKRRASEDVLFRHDIDSFL